LLDASSLMEDAALDRYQFLRDAYLQRRESQVFDGEVPQRKPEPAEAQAEMPAAVPESAGQ
jgi:phospholipid-binding lipoprotein MlaA